MLNLLHVESFIAVAESASFGEAARRLGRSQPTVSQQIRKLEESLQTALLYRDRQACVPTPAGAAFLPYAHSLLKVAARAEIAVKGRALIIGASSNVGIYLLQPHVTAFRENGGAGTEVDLWIGRNPEVADKLERHEVDVAVMEWWDGRPGFAASLWRHEPLVVIVPPDHPWADAPAVDKAQLVAEPLIGGEPGTGTGRVLRAALGAAADGLRVGLQLGSTEAVKHAVKAGLGVSLVLAGTVVDEVRAGSLRALPLAGTEGDRGTVGKELYVIRHANQPDSAPANRFAAHLLSRAAAPG